MLIYAGIDEAGYGPMFGPFVVARTVFRIEGVEPSDDPPSLWRLLKSAVCTRASDRRRRIAVNDSKKLYSRSTGLAALERGVLAFAQLAGHDVATLDQLLDAIGLGADSRIPDLLWYHDGDGHPALPTCWTPDQIAIAHAQLSRAAQSAGLSLASCAAAVVYEHQFNRMVQATRSKARCSWTFVARHLTDIWEHYGRHHPWVVIDRQGGRKVYYPLLELVFEGVNVRLLDESDDISRYVLDDGQRRMTVSFEIGSEVRHLPVALASMTAKYVRELLMMRFNAFWRQRQPELRPTAGYVTDARRFLQDIDPVIRQLNIDRQLLVRSR